MPYAQDKAFSKKATESSADNSNLELTATNSSKKIKLEEGIDAVCASLSNTTL
jgi:hypothetical protein